MEKKDRDLVGIHHKDMLEIGSNKPIMHMLRMSLKEGLAKHNKIINTTCIRREI